MLFPSDPYELHHHGKHLRAFFAYSTRQTGLLQTGLLAAKIMATAFFQRFGLPPAMAPLYMGFDLTYECMCACPFCNRPRMSGGPELSIREILALCREFKKTGVRAVVLGGGEPLMHPHILDILHSLKEQGIKVNLCTNGFLLPELADELLKCRIDHITVSLDSVSPQKHDRLRGVEGLYRKAERGIERIVQSGKGHRPFVRVRMVVGEQNLHEIPEFITQWEGRVDRCLIQPLHAHNSNRCVNTDPIQPIQSVEKLRAILSDSRIGNDFYLRHLPRYLEDNVYFRHLPCYAGYLFARIDPYGNLYPCIAQHHRVGNIRQQALSTLWRSPAFNRVRKNYRTRGCACWYNDTVLFNSYMWTLLGKTFE